MLVAASVLDLLLAFAAEAPADPIEAALAGAFPGYQLAEQAAGDLDGDGRKDVVMTAKKPAPEGESDGEVRPLLAVFLGTAEGKLRLDTSAPQAVCVGCGGAKAPFGEVLGTPSIDKRGVLTVTYEGGSREMWSIQLKWRRDRKTNRFALIGETATYADTLSEDGKLERGSVEREDINYATGKMTRKISGEGTYRCDVKPGIAAPDLARFDFQARGDDDRFVKGSCKR
jgi:hypothetical protein